MTKQAIDYRALNTELEAILASLESNDVEIDQAIKQYQRGSEIVAQLQAYLKTAENKVKKITAAPKVPISSRVAIELDTKIVTLFA